MSVEKTEKVVRAFLSNNSAEVLSIKGNWGVGKTYFWDKITQETKDDSEFCRTNYCYVSLFGIKSLEQLKSTIFQNLKDKSQIGEKFSIDNLQQNIGKLTKQSGRFLSKFLPLIPGVKDFGAFLYSAAFNLVKDTLICIDDLERKSNSLEMKEVLGLIMLLKEERNCKIALIFNETKFGGISQDEYKQFREKVIDIEVLFSRTPAESATIVFTTSGIDTQLSTFTNALQISNIRILRRIKRAADITVPLLREFDPQITHAALQTLALFGWSYYSHTHDDKVPSFSYVTTFGYHFGGGRKTEQEQGWDALLREYGFRDTDKLDVALSSLIENGFIDEDRVRKEAEELNQQLIATNSMNAFGQAWNLFYSFHNDEEEIVRTFERLLKQHVIYVSPINLNGVIEILRELNRDGLASELIDFYVAKRSKDKELFNYSRNLLPFGVKPDKELAGKFDLQLAALEETPTLENALAHIAQDEGWSSAEEKALASAMPDDFVTLFKSATRELLDSYLKASLKFRQLGQPTDRQRAIAQTVTEAFSKIAAESRINKIRLKRYGVSSEEQPRLPL